MPSTKKYSYPSIIATVLILVFEIGTTASAATVCDVNGDGKEGLAETIHSLQVAAGHDPTTVPYTFTNSIGMTFNLIPAGTFTMGSPSGEPGRVPNETQHEVTLTKPFYMQITEVTNKQWNTIVVDPSPSLGVNPSTSHTGDNYPVETVNWFEAAYFANHLSIVEGRTACYSLTDCDTNAPGANMQCTTVAKIDTCTGYRLPTEAEWEYAARAGTSTAYANPVYFDATDTETNTGFNKNLNAMGWYAFNDVAGYSTGTKPVAAKQPNNWGLYDMHGNVSEWCRDWWDQSDYSPSPVVDPTGDLTGSYRVLRGGAWYIYAMYSRSAGRFRSTPGVRADSLGFRLALPPGK